MDNKIKRIVVEYEDGTEDVYGDVEALVMSVVTGEEDAGVHSHIYGGAFSVNMGIACLVESEAFDPGLAALSGMVSKKVK